MFPNFCSVPLYFVPLLKIQQEKYIDCTFHGLGNTPSEIHTFQGKYRNIGEIQLNWFGNCFVVTIFRNTTNVWSTKQYVINKLIMRK